MKPGNLRKLRDEERAPLPAIEPGARAPEHVFCPHCERELDLLDGRCLVCKKSLADLGLTAATAEALRRSHRAGRSSDPLPWLLLVSLLGLVAWALVQPGIATAIAVLFAGVSSGMMLALLPSRSAGEVFTSRAQRSPYLDGLFLYAFLAVLLLVVAVVIFIATQEAQVLSLVFSATFGLTLAFHLIGVVRRL